MRLPLGSTAVPLVLALGLLAATVAGCTTRTNAKLQAQTAYLAGQQQALVQMQSGRRNVIHIIGNVRNPEVPWTEGLTLAQVVVAADYLAPRDPREIVVTRQGQQYKVDPKDLLQGKDWPVEPGDTVEFRP